MHLLHKFFAIVGRVLLSFRYKLKINDPDGVLSRLSLKGKPVLFLPNHPAEIDPVIVSTLFMGSYAPRPVVVEHFYFLPGAMFFLKLLRAIPIPDFEKGANSWKISKGKKTQDLVRKGVHDGDSFLIYPAGHLRRSPKEVIGGSSFIHSMVQEFPDLQIVLINTKGLWGSMFSRAITGQNPDFWQNIVKGVKVVLKNGLFFVPKRTLDIQIEVAKEDFPRSGSRLELNKYLEAWYNRDGEEQVQLVSYSCYSNELLKVEAVTTKKNVTYTDIPDEVLGPIASKIAEITGKAHDDIRPEMEVSSELGLDSLDVASVHAFVDEKWEIGHFTPAELVTVGDFCEAALGRKERQEVVKEKSTPGTWPEEKNRFPVMPPQGETIHGSFLKTAKRMGGAICCADARTPPMTYKRFKIAATILSRKIAKYEGNYVGIMLPSSVGVYLATMATLFAGKIPVMLNWTAGRRALEHADEVANLAVVLSSRVFLDRVTELDLGSLEEKLVLLEDMKKEITLFDKLRAVCVSPKPKGKGSDTAVILFTSGTETNPKGVPLTHTNIIENQKACISVIPVNSKDVLYSVLPPFHSFGFCMTGILPLLFGFKVFYSPDPLDAHAIAEDAAQWHTTFICLAPSFYKNLFKAAKKEQLRTIKYFVTGAERAPQDLYSYVRSLGPNHNIIEGYGITECSPAVSLTPLCAPPKGVGQPIPGTELICIHPESHETLPQGETGEVCIHGPGVFSGYLGAVARDPFIEIDGKKWYRSGDLGYLDKDNYLHLGGRISRFVKIGGEMVSLTAVEEALDSLIPLLEDEKPSHAIAAKEDGEGKAKMVLFSTLPIEVERANTLLRDKGFARIVKVSKVELIDEIPLTGAGKVAYRRLNELASL